jgi:catechol 2,3-dioxygenase-like lactoylglutathione lyase family enzyme
MSPSKCLLIPVALIMVTQLSTFAESSPTQTPRPQILGIDHVTMYVSDLEKSRRFYSDFLGLTIGCPHYAGPDTCFLVRPGDQRVLLRTASPQSGAIKNWVAEIAFATDDLTQMRRYLLAHKITAGTIAKYSDGAQYFRVRDPEGNWIVFVQRPPAKSAFAPSSKQVGSHLIHAGFVVKDMAAENRFYIDLLGFRLYWYGGFKDDTTDWYEIQVPDGPDWIEYMLNIPATADHKELGVQNHFALGVNDVHAAASQLRQNGLTKFDGPEVGRDGKDGLDAYDPDGTRVEIMDFTPSQKPCCHPYSAEHPKPPNH